MGSPNRVCDFCGESKALVYCRADSAKLCFSCDREVHSTNPLFTKHTRSLLCDACDSSPASILCSTESRVWCQNCDWKNHNRSVSSPAHDRRPLDPFSGCPTASDLLAIAGLDHDLAGADKSLSSLDADAHADDAFSDFFIWDTPSFLTFDDLIVPTDSDHDFRAMGVPSLPPKNPKAACGQHKDEVLRQLRQLWKSETGFHSTTGDVEELQPLGVFQVGSLPPEQPNVYIGGHEKPVTPIVRHDSEASAFQWFHDDSNAANKPSVLSGSVSRVHDENQAQSDLPISIANGVVLSALPISSPPEVTPSQDRETAISRYKEKKKTRRYEKHIRYESRKVRAENRIRIKGRFAKMDR